MGKVKRLAAGTGIFLLLAFSSAFGQWTTITNGPPISCYPKALVLDQVNNLVYVGSATFACVPVGTGTAGLADPGSNGPIKRTALNVTGPAAASDIVNLFSACSGTQYLGADFACHTPPTGTNILPTNNSWTGTNGYSISPTVPTASPGDNSTKVADTAFVTAANTLLAPLNSPSFTGTPLLPSGTIATTQPLSDNSTKLATTAYVTSTVAPTGNLALKGVSGDSVIFVTTNGNNSNDGLSLGTAKLTYAAACAAITGGNATCTAGTGMIIAAPGVTPPTCVQTGAPACSPNLFWIGGSFLLIPNTITSSGGALFMRANDSAIYLYDNGFFMVVEAGGPRPFPLLANSTFAWPDLTEHTNVDASGFILGVPNSENVQNAILVPGGGFIDGYMINSGIIAGSGNLTLSAPGKKLTWQNGGNSTTLLGATATGIRSVTLPDATGTVLVTGTGTHSYQSQRGVAGCTTAASVGATCTTVVTWPAPFASVAYTPQCSGQLITSGVPVNGGITNQVAASVTFQTVAATAAVAQFTNIICTAIAD